MRQPSAGVSERTPLKHASQKREQAAPVLAGSRTGQTYQHQLTNSPVETTGIFTGTRLQEKPGGVWLPAPSPQSSVRTSLTVLPPDLGTLQHELPSGNSVFTPLTGMDNVPPSNRKNILMFFLRAQILVPLFVLNSFFSPPVCCPSPAGPVPACSGHSYGMKHTFTALPLGPALHRSRIPPLTLLALQPH